MTVPHGKLSRLRTIDKIDGNALKTTGPKPLETPEPAKLPYDTWHRRLGHLGTLNVKKAQQLAKGIAIDAATFPADDDKCEACILGGQTMHYGDQAMRRRTVPGDLIHSDICGWITPNSLGNARYFIIFIDDATGMTYLYPLPLKTALEVRNAFMEFRNVFEQDGRRIKSIRTDGGGEYRKQMAELCKELGIHHEETAPYTPHQNGVAERANRTICDRIRSIIAETGLPKALWAELARTVTYLKNRSPTRSLKGMTPYEALYGEKPDLSHLIAIGTKAMPHIPKSKNQKLDSRAGEGIMIGYGGSNQYRIWSPVDNKVTVTAYADFIDEAKKPKAAAMEPERTVYDMIEVLPEPPAIPIESDNSVEAAEDDNAVDDEDELETVTIDAREASLVPESAEQPQIETRLPPRRRAPPVRYESEAWTTHAALTTAIVSDSMEPSSYQEAVNHPLYGKEWELAIREEYESLMKNGAWELVEAPPGRNIVTCKWVFKAKRDAEGRIVRFKARLVARGFTQAYGIDYLETYAPVAKLTTYRIIFALAALEQWEIHGMDVITAFLLRKLDEEIFMMQPEGFEREGVKAKMVCKLLRSLYGLKQASRVWNMQLHEFLIKIGFIRSNPDTCLYVNDQNIVIAIWVDDILIAGKDARNIAKVKKQLAGEFSMKDLGPISHFLGMRVTRTADGDVSIDQSTYVKDILARFGMEDSKAVSTPLATGTKLIKIDANSAKPDFDIQPLYQSIVGSLMYAMLCTRPDMAFAVQQLSQFASDPSPRHLQGAKRVLRYLQGSPNLHLTYRRNGGVTESVQSYSDANFAADEDRKSISGYVFTLAGSPISWQAKKQSMIALSTAEAEYAALTQAAKEVIWLQNLLKDLGMTSEEIISRARLAFEHRASLDQFRNTNYGWFARSAREIAPAELLEPFRFPSNIKPEFTFNAFAIMERFAGHNAAQKWDRDGNLLIPNLLNYIREDRRLYEMIGQEFDMYEHHFQPHTSKPKMGFLRNMFYSLTQQLVRQDPAWYALNAACRPSHNWRLISYPYVAKKVVPGERMGFAHTDVNIAKWVEYGHGANQLTSSVSLDQEKPTDCTEIVPGFHHHAIAWYNRLVNHRTKPTGTTTNAVKLYLPEDEQSFGSFQPQVCGPGDVRITRPEIIHGSTPNATISRRVIYPWFTAIQEDHSTLEISGQLS